MWGYNSSLRCVYWPKRNDGHRTLWVLGRCDSSDRLILWRFVWSFDGTPRVRACGPNDWISKGHRTRLFGYNYGGILGSSCRASFCHSHGNLRILHCTPLGQSEVLQRQNSWKSIKHFVRENRITPSFQIFGPEGWRFPARPAVHGKTGHAAPGTPHAIRRVPAGKPDSWDHPQTPVARV